MLRIKALLIEEILMMVLMFYSGFIMSDYISAGSEVLRIMLIMGIMIAIGKSIEAIVDHTVCKKRKNTGLFARFIRTFICLLLSSTVFFVIFSFCFEIVLNNALIIIFAIISILSAIMHLAVSRTIDKTLGLYKNQTFISRP